MKDQREITAQKSTLHGFEDSIERLIERWSGMVTGRDIEILRERREQMVQEAADFRRIAALEACPDERTHILAALGVSLVKAGYALQACFSGVTETQTLQIQTFEKRLVARGSEGC